MNLGLFIPNCPQSHTITNTKTILKEQKILKKKLVFVGDTQSVNLEIIAKSHQKLKNKGIILRSTEDGYHIKNKLRLTIGSSRENLIFMNAVRKIFN